MTNSIRLHAVIWYHFESRENVRFSGGQPAWPVSVMNAMHAWCACHAYIKRLFSAELRESVEKELCVDSAQIEAAYADWVDKVGWPGMLVTGIVEFR